MAYDPDRHHRQSIRLPGYDYSQPGTYFLTLCAHNRECLFGEVMAGEMRRNSIGELVAEEWVKSATMRSELRLDQWIVMPNHLHGIVSISGVMTLERERAHARAPLQGSSGAHRPPPRKAQSISSFVAGFKSAVTSRVNRHRNTPQSPVWQSNFFEHVVRSDRALQAIREYIVVNPQRWGSDRENPWGDGADDVETFVASLDAAERSGCSSASPDLDVASPVRETRAHSRVPLQGETRAHSRVPLQEQMTTQALRIGHGYDLHRLQPGGRLMLAGVEVSQSLSPIAHSDGDVVIHALVDALLGALGWGDIGELFPNTDPQWKDAPSRVFLENVYAKVQAEGYALVNADVTILAERPRLKPFKPAMRQFLESLLGGTINVKAGTNEGCDAIGRGEAIAAHAVVLLAKEQRIESASLGTT
jgi:2-C-methyl-D-erythritol 2,4-cyclodiphosphate synthase